MDWQLDIRTVVLVCAGTMMLVNLLLLAVWPALPEMIRPSLRWWLAGTLLHPLSLILLALRGQVPDALSIVGGNTALALSLTCSAIALRNFYGVPERRERLYVITVLVLLTAMYFSLIEPSLHWRVVLISAGLAVLNGSCARAIFRRGGPRGRIARATGVVFALGTAMLAYRALYELFGAPLPDHFSRTPMQVLSFGFGGVLPVLSTVGFVLMCTERSQEELARVARLDYLTGLFNRRAIEDLARRTIAAARRHGMPMAILIADVDHFKRINDAFGHSVGDVALVEAVRRLRESLRTEDLPGRLGGEEFVALLPNTDAASALAAAERLRHAFADAPMLLEGRSHEVTVSVGVAILQPEDKSFSDLLRRADRAMYAAKSAGRNRVMMDATVQG